MMECLTATVSFDIFMDNYFTSFRLLTHLRVNNIRVTCVLSKNRLLKCTIIGNKHLQKKERGYFEQCTSTKKSVQIWLVWLTVVGWNDSSAIYIASSESCEPFFNFVPTPNKSFVRCWNKVEKKNSRTTPKTWVLSTEWTRT